MVKVSTRERVEASLVEGGSTALGYRISRIPFLARQVDISALHGVVTKSPEQADLLDEVVRIRHPKRGFSAWQSEARFGNSLVSIRRSEAALFIPRALPFAVNVPRDVLLGEFFSETDGSATFVPVASLEDEVYGDAIMSAVQNTCARPVVDAEWAEDACAETAREGWRVLTELSVEPSMDHALQQRTDTLLQQYQL